MANAQISAQEQLLIELVNRARLDPAAEGARYGVAMTGAAPRAPLAPNADLSEAAALHSEWMIATDIFSHTGQGGSSPTARMAAAGYGFTGAWSSGENVSYRGTTGTVDPTAMVLEHHKGLFLSPGHRANILGDFREIGVGQEIGNFRGYNASMVTENFAKTGTKAFITGVAYRDADGDRFYDVGEGTGGVRIDRTSDASPAASTAAAGGYALGIPTGLSGWTNVSVSVGTTTLEARLMMTGGNVKLDVVGTTLAASTDMALGRGAANGRLLGAAPVDLTGNALANLLQGNAGANDLRGLAGNDRLDGGAGADLLEGGTGSDILAGGAGADRFVFRVAAGSPTGHDRVLGLRAEDRVVIDLPGSLPSQDAWESSHISAVTGGWRVALDDGSTIRLEGSLTRAQVEDVLLLA